MSHEDRFHYRCPQCSLTWTADDVELAATHGFDEVHTMELVRAILPWEWSHDPRCKRSRARQ